MKWAALFALGLLLHPSIPVADIEGVERRPLKVETGHVGALFFITNDCPISNYYAHEIRRICEEYSTRGLACSLVYTDPNLTSDQARQHASEYGHGTYPKIVDREHQLVKAAGVNVTPTVVLVTPEASIAYRGRIDNFYAALGKSRRVVTRHDLRDALDALTSGHPAPEPETTPVGCYIPDLSVYKHAQ